jgi:transposase
MHKEAIEELDVRFKLLVLDLTEHSSVTKICREFNVPRASFYRWKKRYDQEGPSGLYRKNHRI